jgi:hypothetical protein
MAKISRDLATPSGGASTLNPRENLFGTGLLAAANAEVLVAADGAGVISLDVRGPYVGTLIVEGTVDGTNWISIPVRPVNAASLLQVITLASAAVGQFIGNNLGYRIIRARMSAYTSGTATATISQSVTPFNDALQGLVTTVLGTAVGASGAAVTLTLASPGAGLRHYLTYLAINRFAAAVLTPAAAPVTVTTTNLPGSLAFSIPAEAAAQGTLDRYREDFAYPLAASAQATATTIVCPVTTGVIWRVTAGYYVAP